MRGNVFDATTVMTLGHVDHSYFLTTVNAGNDSISGNSVQFQKTPSRSRYFTSSCCTVCSRTIFYM